MSEANNHDTAHYIFHEVLSNLFPRLFGKNVKSEDIIDDVTKTSKDMEKGGCPLERVSYFYSVIFLDLSATIMIIYDGKLAFLWEMRKNCVKLFYFLSRNTVNECGPTS